MIFFITFLRALAVCFITNAHYTGIYPTDLIANGGLIGDVLFFAISGYCLYYVKYELNVRGIVSWYVKRVWRVYPAVLIITAVYLALGKYSLSEHGFSWWFIYPTYYHFVASIMILYIPFFFIVKIEWVRKRLISVMLGLFVLWLGIYFVLYDKSFYHIDTVREPMIRFLFMESMLLGAWFRQNDHKIRNQTSEFHMVALFVGFILYFASKVLFSRIPELSLWQFINQIMIFFLLYFLFRMFSGIDEKLEKMPFVIKRVIGYLSKITLEIYVVQYVIIDVIRECHLPFPFNWLLLTACIVACASLLHFVCNVIYKVTNKLMITRR